MEYLDFYSVMKIIRGYINDACTHIDPREKKKVTISQMSLVTSIFASFCCDDSTKNHTFESSQVNRWFNGKAPVCGQVIAFYRERDRVKSLSSDIEKNVLPLMYDCASAVKDVHTLLTQDTNMSKEKKQSLEEDYPFDTNKEKANFLAKVLLFGMDRNFVKRDCKHNALLASGSLSPLMRDFILDVKVPRPCRYFCGRDAELEQLHKLLCEEGKVFLQGIAGIGKSELAKAYAKKYQQEYTNIIYLTYSGDLKNDIVNMEFADDKAPNETADEKFSRHHAHLRKLKEDSLLIIDNFNTVTAKDSNLDVILKYHCRILFTTRSKFENYAFMNLEEIADKEVLFKLMGCFYSDAEKDRPILEQIIQTVHSHTLAVEMSARLLNCGIIEPADLLKKLKEEKAAMDASETIGISKDGKSRKATYYDHIHTLFSLYQLSEEETNIMRNLVLIPLSGVQNRLFASWMKLYDMNIVNDLIEKGFVNATEERMIALHPMMRDVTAEETKPSVQNCRTLLDSIQSICVRHGEEVSYYKQMFQTVGSIIQQIKNDDMPTYLLFLENVFPYMENYHYYHGMKLVVDKLSALLNDETIGSVSDHALLLSYRVYFEKKPNKAIKMQNAAIAMIAEVTEDNALMMCILYANLGVLYHTNCQLALAKLNMERAAKIMKEYNLEYYHDVVIQMTNYAVLLADIGQGDFGLSELRKVCRELRQVGSDKGLDYARVQEAMGNISLTMGKVQQARSHFQRALEIYETIFESEPEKIEAKKQELRATYAQAGSLLGKKILEWSDMVNVLS